MLFLTLFLSGCATTGIDDPSLGWFCSAETAEGPARAVSHRGLSYQGELQTGRTQFDLTLAGTAPARLLAEWQVDRGLPEMAEGRYRFRMTREVVPAEPGQLQLVGGGVILRGRDWSPGVGELAVSGRELAALLGSGAAIRLRTVARDGRELGSVPLGRSSFDLALQLARQADAGALAKAADYRSLCERQQRIIPT